MLITDTGSRPDGRLELHLSPAAGVTAGLALAILTTVPVALFLSDDQTFQFLAVQLGFIGAIYFGFGVAEGSVRALLVECNGAFAFLALGAVSLWTDSAWLLAAGYLAHGVWDALHHPRARLTTVQPWYPPFCVVYDVAVAAAIVVWLV